MIKTTIDANTIIGTGLNLSQNLILGHTTSGAYHYVLGRIIPQYTAFLKPGSSTLPTWQVAKNLQLGAQGLLEGLLNEFGGDLILKSAFSPNLSSIANLGQSFDVQIRGYENNMYNVAKTIQNLSGRADSLSLIYGNSSFMRMNFSEKSIKTNLLNNTFPKLSSIDNLSGIFEQGFTSILGI
jgi:hypothetical protein